MNNKRRIDPDRRSATPFPVLRGEWWEDRKRELAKMNRAQLKAALIEVGVDSLPDSDQPDGGAPLSMRWDSMLWLRLRLAGEEQITFHVERNEPVPESMRPALDLMDKNVGWVPVWRTNIFYDVDGEGAAKREETTFKNKIEEIVQRDIAAQGETQ